MITVLGTAIVMTITTETETTMAMVQVGAMAITTGVKAMTEIGTSSRTLPSSVISIIGAVAEAEVAVVAGLTEDEVEEDLREAADTVAMITAKAATMVTMTETAAMEAAITTTTTTTTTAVVTFLASVELGTLVVAVGAVAQPEEDTEPPLRMIDTERNENNRTLQQASRKSQFSSFNSLVSSLQVSRRKQQLRPFLDLGVVLLDLKRRILSRRILFLSIFSPFASTSCTSSIASQLGGRNDPASSQHRSAPLPPSLFLSSFTHYTHKKKQNKYFVTILVTEK